MRDGSAPDPALLASLRELAGRLGLRVHTRTGAEPSWVSLRLSRSEDGATDLALDGRNRPSVQRHVAPAANPALEHETVAHVALAMLETALADAASEPPPVEPPAAAPPAEPPPTAPPAEPLVAEAASSEPPAARDTPTSRAHATLGTQLRADAAAGVVWLATHEAASHVEGALGWAGDHRIQPALTLAAGGSFLPQVSRPEFVAQLNLASLRVRPSLIARVHERISLEVALPVGLDVAALKLVAIHRDDGLPERQLRSVQPVVGMQASAHIRIWNSLALAIAAGLDLDLKPRTWTIGDEARALTVAELSRVRPCLTAGLSWGAAN